MKTENDAENDALEAEDAELDAACNYAKEFLSATC